MKKKRDLSKSSRVSGTSSISNSRSETHNVFEEGQLGEEEIKMILKNANLVSKSNNGCQIIDFEDCSSD